MDENRIRLLPEFGDAFEVILPDSVDIDDDEKVNAFLGDYFTNIQAWMRI